MSKENKYTRMIRRKRKFQIQMWGIFIGLFLITFLYCSLGGMHKNPQFSITKQECHNETKKLDCRMMDYNSTINPIKKDELNKLLSSLNLI